MITGELTFSDTVNGQPQVEFRRGRQVQVEAPVAVARAAAFGGRDGTSAGATGVAIIVAPLVSPECLTGGERPVTDGAFVRPTGRIKRSSGGSSAGDGVVVVGGSSGGCGGGGEFAVAGFVAA